MYWQFICENDFIRFKVCYNLEIQVIFHKYSSKYLISLVNLCNVNVERKTVYFLSINDYDL